MAVETPKTLRQRFHALSNPGKALVFVIPLCVVALAVAAIVVGGSRPEAARPVTVEKPSVAKSVESSASTSMPELPPGHPSIGASGTAAASSAASGSKSGSGSSDSKPSSSSKSSSSGSKSSDQAAAPKNPVEVAAEKIPADAVRPPGDLSDAWRLKIAKELAAAEERATAEADAKFPTDPKKGGSKGNSAANKELQSELVTKYQNEIATKYKLTSDELISILILEVPSLQ
ncbi:MAG TPA: hypothetical protein VFG89_00125 [Coriobacteriia bacterium]|nr:hypothetical protein [Coriobacteriia bacterium]